jgi:nucleoside-diphosphate-sugar epimerase
MIFLIGASSFVGRAILKILEDINEPYRIISRYEIYHELDEVLNKNTHNIILIHCAWSMNYDDSSNSDINDKMNTMILNVISNIEKIIFISSIHALNKNNAYTRDKNKWEGLFQKKMEELKAKLITIYLPHLVAPEVGFNNNSVIYKFYKEWKNGANINIHEDADIQYTDLNNFKNILIQAINANNTLRLVPKYHINKVSHIKSEFISNNSSCEIIKKLKDSSVIVSKSENK